MADFRRAVRLGRLLRQDHVTLLGELVGVACIRYGLEGIYETASKQGDGRLALVTAVALSEVAPQRLRAAATVTDLDISPFIKKDAAGVATLELPDARFEAIVTAARTAPDRWARGEPTISLGLLRTLGTPTQRDKAKQALEELATSDDWAVAALAKHGLAFTPKPGYLATIVQP